MIQAQEPDYRIFKTLPLAIAYAKRLTEETGIKHIATCVLTEAYLVAPEEFNAIKAGFGYPDI